MSHASSASASRISESVHLCRAASIRTTVPIFGLLTHAPEVSRCGNQYPEHQQGRGLVYFGFNDRRTMASPRVPVRRTEAQASQGPRVPAQSHP